MEAWKRDVSGLSGTSAAIMNAVGSRQSGLGRQISLLIRVRRIDCMLADIEARIRRLRQESSYLRLVRTELIDDETKPRQNSPCRTSVKESDDRVRVKAAELIASSEERQGMLPRVKHRDFELGGDSD